MSEGVLTFKEFQRVSKERCEVVWPEEKDRNISYWLACITKELGELAKDVVDYEVHGAPVPMMYAEKKNMARELADLTAYIALAYQSLDLDMATEVADKFNIVSDRVHWRGQRL